MRYCKPELRALPSAVDAIQMQEKTALPLSDSSHTRTFTPAAYEADE